MTNDEFFAFCDKHQLEVSFMYAPSIFDSKRHLSVYIDTANSSTIRLFIEKELNTYQDAIEKCKEFAKEFEASGFDIYKRYY